jgi:outer membrane lipoprotein-sorting protein
MSLHRCIDIEPRLRSFLDGELTDSEAAEIRDHLDGCPSCRASLEAAKGVARLVGRLPGEIEPPPHFGADLQIRLAALRAPKPRPRWSRRYSLAGATLAGSLLALILGAPPRIGAQDLVGKVQASWQQLQSYSCRFVAEGIVRGRPRRFEQRQWFHKPNLFRLETNEHYPEQTYIEADRVTTFIPGARWHGERVAIVRPRRAREAGLPFPFGADWPTSYDVTMDALVHELKTQQDGELLGTEELLGKLCHMLKFRVQRPGERLPTHYIVWVDQESFLPLRVKQYRDTNNQTISTAIDLQTNVMTPLDTFHFRPTADTFTVYGEVEPFVFALPLDHPRPAAYDTDPLCAVRDEMQARAGRVPFVPLAPTYLPDGYGLVRVRAARDRWLDAYWLHPDTGAVIQLVEQAAGPSMPEQGEASDGTSPDGAGRDPRWHEVRRPFPIQYVDWTRGGIQLSLAAAGIEREQALRIAASLKPVDGE